MGGMFEYNEYNTLYNVPCVKSRKQMHNIKEAPLGGCKHKKIKKKNPQFKLGSL